MVELIALDTLVKTCSAFPAQWEGRLTDGRCIYIRYRYGRLIVGLGATMDEAIDDDDTFSESIGGGFDGQMSTETMLSTLAALWRG